MVLMGAAFTSCSKDIAFDNEAVAQQQIAKYQENFVKKYGPVDPNQSWDFSNPTPITYLTDGPGATRSAGAASSPITVLSQTHVTRPGGGKKNIRLTHDQHMTGT